MSGLYQSIPPGRRDAYLAHANNEVVSEKFEDVIKDMGDLVVQDVVDIIMVVAGDLELVADEAEVFLQNPDLLTETDKNFLTAHDVAKQRQEQPEMSFAQMYIAASKARNPEPPKMKIDEEFRQKYLADEDH